MKTKTLIMMCLLAGAALTQLSAQVPDPPDNKHGTGTVVGLHVYENYEWPVFCNNELVDILRGTIYANYEVHFDRGEFVFAMHHCTAEAVSVGFSDGNGGIIGGTGEAFKIINMPRKYNPTWDYQYEIINCLGNLGTHYVMRIAWDNVTWEPTVMMSQCLGNKK
jgi:hypothetical protein